MADNTTATDTTLTSGWGIVANLLGGVVNALSPAINYAITGGATIGNTGNNVSVEALQESNQQLVTNMLAVSNSQMQQMSKLLIYSLVGVGCIVLVTSLIRG